MMKNFNLNLYKREWLAVVFAGRNQQYGAYQLRMQDGRHHLRALVIASVLFSAAFLIPFAYQKWGSEGVSELPDKVVRVTEYHIPEKIYESKKERVAAASAGKSAAKVASKRFTSQLQIVNRETSAELPSQAELKNVAIGRVDMSGVESVGNQLLVKGSGQGNGSGMSKNNGISEENSVFTEVEVQPQFIGGDKAWASYLQNNLVFPSSAAESGVQGKVILRFVVEKNGTVTDIKVLKSVNKACDDAAIKVIQNSPRWRPGIQNGLPVRVLFTIPINFVIGGY